MFSFGLAKGLKLGPLGGSKSLCLTTCTHLSQTDN